MTRPASGYGHDTLFYTSDQDLVASAAPFLRAALDAAETTVLICTERTARLLGEAAPGNPRIRFVDRSEVYRRVPGAISAYQQIAERQLAAGTRRLRLVGEVDFGADQDSWAEWARFEAIINTGAPDLRSLQRGHGGRLLHRPPRRPPLTGAT
jgi:hypothetical protein